MIRGERFELDLSSDEESNALRQTPLPAAFVGDVLERKSTTARAPSAPTLKSKTGFPEHKKQNLPSCFKQKRVPPVEQDAKLASATPDGKQLSESELTGPAGGKPKSWEEEEKERIDQENRRTLAAMSTDEIEDARRELESYLSPAALQRLMLRSNIQSGSNEVDLSRAPEEQSTNGNGVVPKAAETAAFQEPGIEVDQDAAAKLMQPEAEHLKPKNTKTVSFQEVESKDDEAAIPEPDHHDHTSSDTPSHDSIHFPRAPQPPDLDPASDTFLEDLHAKYFPSLPSEPSKLAWMRPAAPSENSYDPTATVFKAKDIRFSFKGALLAPRDSAAIPVTEGLHHHGDAPDAAGYTIAELAHLARSAVAAQRCIAFQTLGRILYRLGKGEFGNSGEAGEEVAGVEETFGELARGLWREVDRGKVVEILAEESEGRGVGGGRHVSSQAYATEALWLWNKGGGRRWKAG